MGLLDREYTNREKESAKRSTRSNSNPDDYAKENTKNRPKGFNKDFWEKAFKDNKVEETRQQTIKKRPDRPKIEEKPELTKHRQIRIDILLMISGFLMIFWGVFLLVFENN